mmetsp:Transcript_45224/g.86475  ORF Transcript_45224/g.86475 Transcript_45224/m.86475 type:complete len:281 (-) Transcript_45224:232-1074(-)|eukprot:CAMPEP_0114256520 /NCGR_PEP_ID=MMETSP0058-20121206/18203_1 /TAXON_ID=36894 /ORGANISM="Pyramimonas parkeae, CCMP726" /LENGTH=280 /DNA_ID=CAMNT_0001371105 /DNA_START=139 /DNA_END=981 /DNA_ORIENTATION=+
MNTLKISLTPCAAKCAFPATKRAQGETTVATRARQLSVSNPLVLRASTRPAAGRRALIVSAGAEARPTVAETKAAFMNAYPKPIPAMFNTIVQELLVSQHLYMTNTKYEYNALASLGFVSVFDQIFESYTWGSADDIYSAYVSSLNEDPKKVRSDADDLLAAAKSATSAADVAAMPAVKALAARAASGKLLHNKFLAIGLFRALEAAGLTDPEALKELVSASGLKQEDVSRDLLTYKSLLSKLNAAKDLQKEFVERERKKAAERAAEKEAKATASAEAEA